MKLYYSPLSTFSHKAMLAFHEKGVAFAPELVDLGSQEARAAYEKINPTGKVPFLLADNGWQVPESTSIIEYLEDEFPNTPKLIPTAGEGTPRQVRFMDRVADLYFNEPIVELLLQQIGLRAQDAARADRARKYVQMAYGFWSKRLATQPWLCGSAFTMADCAAIPALFYAQIVAPFTDQPNVAAYWRRAQERPSYVRIRAEFEPIWNARMAQQRVA
ncbi:MAG: glutathione S-transferase family protein [Gammaproteobacteria bacterium]